MTDDLQKGVIDISIHALARRATHALVSDPTAIQDFNPRSRKESDA